jgi:hypothetical protein
MKSLNAWKKYTKEESNFILDNFGKLSINQIADELGRSFQAIKRLMAKNNIKASKSFHGHDYITEKDFISEIEQIKGITRWIYYDLRDEGIIKITKHETGTNYLSEKQYDKWIEFFKTHTVSSYFINHCLPKTTKRWKQTLLYLGNIKYVKFKREHNKYWIVNEDIKRVQNILNNYTMIYDLKDTGYTRAGIRMIIKRKYISDLDWLKWNGRIWVNNKEIKRIIEYGRRFLNEKN